MLDRNFSSFLPFHYLWLSIKLVAPDGQMLTMCDRKKADWYVKMGLGTILVDDNQAYIVQLNFEPAGSLVFK